MAEGGSGGGVGILGVLVGAMLVLIIGAGVLFATGKMPGSGGGSTSTLKVELPKATTGSK
jgi:hypothetical protein